MSNTREALMKMSRQAADTYLASGTEPSDSIRKIAEQHQLTDAHVERVCHFTNHLINGALMKKEAYTTFPVARAEDVRMPKVAASTLIDVPAPEVAVEEPFEPVLGGVFSKLAEFYGADYTPTGDPTEDGRRFERACEVIVNEALDSFEVSKIAMESEGEAFYHAVKEEILSGTPLDVVAKAVEEQAGPNALQEIWDRLEAEGMVPLSMYDDGGPYSLERAFKRASDDSVYADYELSPDGPLVKSARGFQDAMEQSRLDAFGDPISSA